MGTRGAFGFRINNEDKVTYNHYDSYPSELGSDILTALSGETLEHLKEVAEGITLIDENVKPTPEQIELCKPWTDTTVSGQSTDDWYCLLRMAQGDLTVWTKGGLTLMSGSSGFLLDSLFCEWAYIVNLDTEALEVYSGFNKDRKAAGRYASSPTPSFDTPDGRTITSEYYGVKLIKEVPLKQVFTMTDGDRAALVEELEADEDDE